MRREIVTGCAAALLAAAALAQAAEAQSPTLLRIRNAQQVDRMVLDSAGGLVLAGNLADGPPPVSGPGARMVWWPRQAAFRAGIANATEFDPANLGYGSVALGKGNLASGGGAVAIGETSVASGTPSLALGRNAKATTDWAVAVGFSTTASATLSTAVGISSSATGTNATAVGSSSIAAAPYASAFGFNVHATGDRALALGSYVSAGFAGSIVIGDGSAQTSLSASAANQFSVRAAGGYRLFTNAGTTLGAQLQPNQTTWSALSDRRAKTAFLEVDGEDVLQRLSRVPVSTWIYRDQPDPSVRHIGPMAQDWAAAFGLSADSTTINAGDVDGVALAAARALDARTRVQAERIRALESENAAVRAALAEMRARMERMEARVAAQEGAP
ncbi:MAG TPA: tail fiber domain-containing protein [Longimicrobium sp.]|jgi:hypothetical protein|uniref:tail fiber domain-containing protein n=1 Tax=Longimicrobium sp. TaxID=2029185 RepID=UPI002ED89F81